VSADRPSAFAAMLTPEGRGAVAVVRIWGPGAVAVADAAFRPRAGRSLAVTPAGRLRVGQVGAGLGDEVVAVVIAGDPPEVEIQGHGGPAAVALVLAGLAVAGATVATAADWATHASASNLIAQATLDLAEAPTLRTAAILLDQADGALDEALAAVIDAIDRAPAQAIAGLDALIARAAVGVRLIDGWRVVLAGRPNVGKSRLMNALAGYDRAIVSPTPGTTRDVVTARVALDGWPVELADTAGLRASDDPIEAAGIARARARQAAADLIVLVLDRSEPLSAGDRGLIAAHPEALVVANKSDLSAAWSPEDSIDDCSIVSAARGDGIEDLAAAIAARLVPESPPPGAAVPFRAAHAAALRRARRLLAGGRPSGTRRALARLIKSSLVPTLCVGTPPSDAPRPPR